MKERRSSRGQSSVEFTIFSVILIILMLIPVQLAWIGMQKWQFTHFASSAARTWTVHKDQSPSAAMLSVQTRALLRGWKLFSSRWIGLMTASTSTKNITKGDGSTLNAQGLKFQGLGRIIPIFRPFFGFSGPYGYFGIEAISTRALLTIGFAQFEGFIPMEREPTEQPGQRRDNDCNETPCSSGNKR